MLSCGPHDAVNALDSLPHMSTKCGYHVAGRPAGYAGSPRPGAYGTPQQQLQRPQGYIPQQVRGKTFGGLQGFRSNANNESDID